MGNNNNNAHIVITIPVGIVENPGNVEEFYSLNEDKLTKLTEALDDKFPLMFVNTDVSIEIDGDYIILEGEEGYPFSLTFLKDNDDKYTVTIKQEGGQADQDMLRQIADVVREALELQAGGRRRRRGAVSKKAKRRAGSMKRTRRHRRRSHRSRK